MKIIEPSIEVLDNLDGQAILKKIEKIGRVCYKSENNITEDSAERFIQNIIKNGHESVLEHVSISVRVICDRGVSHEIVRHRITAYSQESTRYCNYSQKKFNKELTFIKPIYFENKNNQEINNIIYNDFAYNNYEKWVLTCNAIEENYFEMLDDGATPEEARSILPNSLKTEIVMTMNLREWRHFFKLRCSKRAHIQMRQIANMILDEFKKEIPIIFDDIEGECK